MSFKPMLAGDAELGRLTYPKYGSPKLDGMRVIILNGQPLSRYLKPIPNKQLHTLLSNPAFEGLDGELIYGSPASPTCYLDTISRVKRMDAPADGIKFHVFDKFDAVLSYETRLRELEQQLARCHKINGALFDLVPQTLIESFEVLEHYEARMVASGYEGVMLRCPDSPYKQGRSTAKEGWLLKVKRFEDSEAEVLGVEEEMYNGNEAVKNALGRTQRSTAKAGLVGKGTMGALICRDIHGLHDGREFRVGTGFTALDRARKNWKGKIIKYKYFPVGMKDLPRHPVYLGERIEVDREAA